MPTYDIVLNVAKGRVAELATLPLTNDALVAIPLQTTGIVPVATMRDYTTVADLLAGATDEQTTMGRKTLANVTSTVDQAGDKRIVDADDIVWTAASGAAVSALLIAYDNDTTGGTDANLVPLIVLDMVVTPNGGDITFAFNAGGIFQAA